MKDLFRASLVGSASPPLGLPAGYLLECTPQFALCPVLGTCEGSVGRHLVEAASAGSSVSPDASDGAHGLSPISRPTNGNDNG